jgi:hypothetical protein
VFQECSVEWGAGIYCQGGAPTIIECKFVDNVAGDGSAIACDGSDATISGCLFYGNGGGVHGGGAICIGNGAEAVITNCTMCGNSASRGGAILCYGGASPTVENTIMAFNTDGGAVVCWPSGCDLTLICCDIYGNVGGGLG